MTETTLRKPAVAGLFYPDDPQTLDATVDALLAGADTGHAQAQAPRAIAVPHAGYIYSGSVAASAYARLLPFHGQFHRVILLGPAHRVALHGMALPTVDGFATPLGRVAIDTTAREQLHARHSVVLDDRPHRDEHSLEVQLPFLQKVLDRFTLVPLVVGTTTPEAVAEAMTPWIDDPHTLLVVSTDLSHYHDYATARSIDAQTSSAIESLQGDTIDTAQACGALPLRGLLLLAQRRGMSVTTLDIRNSGDTAGPRDRVVGYGAWEFHETAQPDTVRLAA